ncbi:MAG: hypothetical protein DME32_12345 [Verrucomicrobia bacterium]|nr:MAG: hypothetical protein DME32_12345 [Verrucomicrobiota bacterium]
MRKLTSLPIDFESRVNGFGSYSSAVIAEPSSRQVRKRLTHCFVLAAESNNGRTLLDPPIKYAKESDRSRISRPCIRAFAHLGLGAFEIVKSILVSCLDSRLSDSVVP